MNASKFRLNVILSVLLALGLLFAAAPRGISAESGQTLNVAKWGDATQINLAGRPTVLKVGETYHMWYGANDTTLYYTSGNSPTSFGDVKETTYNTKPVEVASPAIVEESGTYYMVAYGVTTTVFNIYTSTDGVAWTDQGQVFDGTGLTNWVKIDAPMLLADSGGYKLYFQVKSSAETNPYSIYVATATDTSLSDMAISASGKDFTLEKEVLPVGDPGAWDDWRLQHPWVVKDGANYYMWYVGYSHASTVQKLGFAYSKDGINWTKSAGNPVFDTRVAEPAVINDGGTWHLWYLDPASKISYRSSSAPFTVIQDAINAALAGDIIEVSGTINIPNGLVIDQPGLTILLKNETIIQNNSPCFVVNADNTTIKAESIGGAQCIPTAGSNGIDVIADISGLTVDGLEFVGTTGANGIHFAGAITNFQIVNNWFHNFAGNAIEFTVQPDGVDQIIQGNLFQGNGGSVYNAGSIEINAEYNSWGQYAKTMIATVDTDPWTHVDLWLESSGSPSANQVIKGADITYAVKADMKNVMGADFTLNIPAGLTIKSTALGDVFVDNQTLIPGTNSITFKGYKLDKTPVDVAGATLFTVTLTAPDTTGSYVLSFDETSDDFSMFPGYGPSTHIYAAGLTGATVKVVDPPTITSSDIQGYYLTGETRDFYVLTKNPSTGGDYQHALFKYVIQDAAKADIKTFQYYTGSAWADMQLSVEGSNLVGEFGIAPTGFHMSPGHSANTQFHIEFNTAKNYPFILTLVDRDAGDYELARLDKTANVYTPPALSSTLSAGPFLGGVEKDFTVTLNNPATGINTDVKAKFTLYGALSTDIAKIEYLEVPGDTWKDLLVSQDGSNLVGYFGPSSGFPMSLGYNATSNFRITFANGITKSYSYDIELLDTKTMPDRLLTKLSGQIDVYANYSLTGIFSMQGRTFRGGIPVTLTGVITGFGPYTLDSTDVLGVNWNLTDVAAGAYTITTSQPRYLNVTTDLGKTIDVTSKTAIAALELKGGDATGDNIIGTGDASVIGTQYGSTGADKNGDVNFSNKVDIFDLALVGGNYGLDSSVYSTWTP